MVFQLDDELWFPDPHKGEADGLIAVGGDLSAKRLLLAYANGFFPWFSFHDGEVPHWYCPMQRYVIFPNEIHTSHSMKQLLRQNRYAVTINQDFDAVIRGCSTVNGRNQEYGAWLGPSMVRAYTRLHDLGFAASVEVWELSDGGRRLVGGLYGVTLRRAFFGESMFSLVPNASKLALLHLAATLAASGAHFIDCQFETPLFKSMGGRYIPYDTYMHLLNAD